MEQSHKNSGHPFCSAALPTHNPLDRLAAKVDRKAMRKVFPLEVPRLKPPRVIDAIKHELRKYLKRERRKALPEGSDFWDFDCRTGRDRDSAELTHVSELNTAVDTAAREQWEAIYIEILAKPGTRARREREPSPESPDSPGEDA